MPRRALLLAGIAALTAVPANASVGGFRLPPGPTPTPTSRVEGPVDPDLPRAAPSPAPAPAPTPSPRATAPARPAPASGATATPVVQPIPARPSPTPTPRPAPARSPQPSPTPAANQAATPAPGAPAPSPAADSAAQSPPLPAFTPSPSPAAAPVPAEAADTGEGWPWGWIGGLAGLLALAAGLGLWIRRRTGRPRGTVLMVPEIEKPRVPAKPAAPEAGTASASLPEPTFAPPADAPPAAPVVPPPAEDVAAPADRAEHPLHILIQPVKLTQTVMNVTLGYRLELTNRGADPLTGLVVAADLVSAHASLPREALLAGPESVLPEKHRVASLAPDETIELNGELRLPLASVVPIRQGSAVILVPLARFRASADSADSRCFTVVVGQPAASGAVQPYRLDQGLRTVEGLTGRAF